MRLVKATALVALAIAIIIVAHLGQNNKNSKISSDTQVPAQSLIKPPTQKQNPVTTEPPASSSKEPSSADKSNCDPNYNGSCVPNVYPSDVDCAGGSGNGPYYVQGPVYLAQNGVDVYGLDRDGDGVGCE